MSRTRRQVPGPSGPGWKIAGVVLGVVVLLVALDLGLRVWAERWLGSRLQSELSLSARPDLDLGGFPFVFQVARGRFPEVNLEADGLESEGLRLDRVRLNLEGVRFAAGDLLTGGEGAVRADSGDGLVEITDEDLTVFLQEIGKPVVVEFLGPRVRVSTTVQIGGEESTATAEARLHLEEGALVFRPRRVEVEGAFGIPGAALVFLAPLPRVVGDVSYDRLTVRAGRAALEFDLRDALIRLVPPEGV